MRRILAFALVLVAVAVLATPSEAGLFNRNKAHAKAKAKHGESTYAAAGTGNPQPSFAPGQAMTYQGYYAAQQTCAQGQCPVQTPVGFPTAPGKNMPPVGTPQTPVATPQQPQLMQPPAPGKSPG